MKLRKIVSAIALAVLPISAGAAPLLDAELGAAIWGVAPSGKTGTSLGIDLEEELGLNREASGFVWAMVDPLLLPRMKLSYSSITADGNGKTIEAAKFGKTIFAAGDNVSGTLNMEQIDASIAVQPIDLGINFGIGIKLKFLDAEVEVKGASGHEVMDFSAPVPMLYANAGLTLPMTGLSAQAEAAGIAFNGSHMVDAQVGVRYQFMPSLHIEGGYRYESLKLDDVSDMTIDASMGGPYLGLILKI